jgi:hypothetical protein
MARVVAGRPRSVQTPANEGVTLAAVGDSGESHAVSHENLEYPN